MLAEFEDPALVQRSLDYAASNKVRNQDALIQFAIALQIDATRDAAWQYIKGHWDTIKNLLTPELGSSLVGSAGAFCSAEDRDDVKAFFAKPQGAGYRTRPSACRGKHRRLHRVAQTAATEPRHVDCRSTEMRYAESRTKSNGRPDFRTAIYFEQSQMNYQAIFSGKNSANSSS